MLREGDALDIEVRQDVAYAPTASDPRRQGWRLHHLREPRTHRDHSVYGQDINMKQSYARSAGACAK